MKRYLIITLRTPNFQINAVEPHYTFLQQLRDKNQIELAGPFSDKTGGAYILLAKDRVDAEQIAFSDPLHTTASSTITICEWQAH